MCAPISELPSFISSMNISVFSGLCARAGPLPSDQEEHGEEQVEHKDGEASLRLQDVRPRR